MAKDRAEATEGLVQMDALQVARLAVFEKVLDIRNKGIMMDSRGMEKRGGDKVSARCELSSGIGDASFSSGGVESSQHFFLGDTVVDIHSVMEPNNRLDIRGVQYSFECAGHDHGFGRFTGKVEFISMCSLRCVVLPNIASIVQEIADVVALRIKESASFEKEFGSKGNAKLPKHLCLYHFRGCRNDPLKDYFEDITGAIVRSEIVRNVQNCLLGGPKEGVV